MNYKAIEINTRFDSDLGRWVAETTNTTRPVAVRAQELDEAQDKIKDEIDGYLKFCENNSIEPIKSSKNEKT